MPITKKPGREQGAYFEIASVVNAIKLKEAKGQDASFERELLKSWSKYKGYESAKQALDKLRKP